MVVAAIAIRTHPMRATCQKDLLLGGLDSPQSRWGCSEIISRIFAVRNDNMQPDNVLFVIKNSTKSADVTALNSSEVEFWQSKKQKFRTVGHEADAFQGAKIHKIYLEEV